MKAGNHIKAIMPDGIEKGVVIEKHGRLKLDEGNHNIHAIDGGFPNGTEFITDYSTYDGFVESGACKYTDCAECEYYYCCDEYLQ